MIQCNTGLSIQLLVQLLVFYRDLGFIEVCHIRKNSRTPKKSNDSPRNTHLRVGVAVVCVVAEEVNDVVVVART